MLVISIISIMLYVSYRILSIHLKQITSDITTPWIDLSDMSHVITSHCFFQQKRKNKQRKVHFEPGNIGNSHVIFETRLRLETGRIPPFQRDGVRLPAAVSDSET